MGNIYGWSEGKKEHMVLSGLAASEYDDNYGKDNFATHLYMNYEHSKIEKYINIKENKSTALDIGCGTGKYAFYMGGYFNQVIGYDFSPEMISVANKNKLIGGFQNIDFYVHDIENGIPCENNSISFINLSFGMGSFVKDIHKLYNEVYRVLEVGGIAVFSFYNSEAFINTLDIQWKPSLGARYSKENEDLEVSLNGHVYKIKARGYSVDEIHTITNTYFGDQSVLELNTFPTMSALLPKNFISQKRIIDLCIKIDSAFANDHGIAGGAYILSVCKK